MAAEPTLNCLSAYCSEGMEYIGHCDIGIVFMDKT